MKRKSLIFTIAVFVIAGFTLPVASQAQEHGSPYLMVWDVVVKPSMVAEYDAATINEVAFYGKYNFPYEWKVYSTNDYHYYFVMEMENYTEIDKEQAAGDDLFEKGGDEAMKMWSLFDGTFFSMDRAFLKTRPELSYIPKNPRLTEEEAQFVYWGFCYIIPGKEAMVEENFKKFISIAEKNNFMTGWNTLMADFSRELPYLVYTETGSSAGDFFSTVEKESEVAGEEIQKLWLETMKYLRKYELKIGTYRPELSYLIKDKKD